MEATELWGLVQCCKDSTQPCSVVEVHVSLDSWYWQLHMSEDLTSVRESRTFSVKKIDSNDLSCSPPLKRAKKQGQMPFNTPSVPFHPYIFASCSFSSSTLTDACGLRRPVRCEWGACLYAITILAVTEYRHYTVLSTTTPWVPDHWHHIWFLKPPAVSNR